MANYAKLSEENSNFPGLGLLNQMTEGPSEQPQYGPMEYGSPNTGFFSDVSAACYEAQKALSAEENSLAKIPLQLACETACAGDARATCDPSETASAYGSPNTGFFSMRIQPKFLPGTSMSGSGLNMFHYFKKSSCHTSLKVLVY